jgi:m7GpppX diphosphatase
MSAQRDQGRLNWVFNILDGLAEQEDVMYRETDPETGFLVSPDLNWDRKTMSALHVLALVQRRDIWSVRDLRREHVPWLKTMRRKILDAVEKVYEGVEEDQLKLYVHCKFAPSLLVRGNSLMWLVDRSADVLSFPCACCACDSRCWCDPGGR